MRVFGLSLSACLVLLSGCSVDETKRPIGETLYRLDALSELVLRLKESGHIVCQYGSVDDLLEDARAKGMIREAEVDRLSTDYWGRPYRWEVEVRPPDTVIRIISSGRDGVFENGEGDDVSIEIRIPERGRAIIRVRPQ